MAVKGGQAMMPLKFFLGGRWRKTESERRKRKKNDDDGRGLGSERKERDEG